MAVEAWPPPFVEPPFVEPPLVEHVSPAVLKEGVTPEEKIVGLARTIKSTESSADGVIYISSMVSKHGFSLHVHADLRSRIDAADDYSSVFRLHNSEALGALPDDMSTVQWEAKAGAGSSAAKVLVLQASLPKIKDGISEKKKRIQWLNAWVSNPLATA